MALLRRNFEYLLSGRAIEGALRQESAMLGKFISTRASKQESEEESRAGTIISSTKGGCRGALK